MQAGAADLATLGSTESLDVRRSQDSAELVDTWAVPDRMREQVILRDPTCVFPRCNRSSRSCDLDHTTAWHDGGATTPDNVAPLCRRHHRPETHGGWIYQRLPDGDIEWTTRLGHTDLHHDTHHRRP